jgi:hypothetical protein
VIMGVAAFGFEAPPALPPPPVFLSTVLTNSVFVGVLPDALEPDGVDIVFGYNVSLFVSSNQVSGVLFTEENDFPPPATFRVFATVDKDSVLGGDDPTSVEEAQAFLAAADSAQIAIFDAGTPATITDSAFFPDFGFGWGRWTNGLIFSTDDDSPPETIAEGLTGNQSLHFIFGQDPGVIATSGSASYGFIGGTRSTSADGSTIGNGVTSGTININFAGSGDINMMVDHIADFPYTVFGTLNVISADNAIFDVGVTATTGDSGSACFSSGCAMFMDGGFAGPAVAGVPGHIGIEYDIQDTDVVMGVAGFGVVP